ncbi:MAG: DUF2442 domain-containing protein [Acidobacteriota bacterium]|nr:DUF2442 domain-containing protein [Acidobacteriota bacterium]
MTRPVKVEPRRGFKLWLRFSDGAEGVVDLSPLAGRGVFRCWDAADIFDAVRVTEHGSVVWGDDVELCPDALYLQVTGKAVDELMPGAAHRVHDA